MVAIGLNQSSDVHMDNKNKKIPSIHEKNPYTWSVTEVSHWISTTEFANKRKKFKKAKINGRRLFELDKQSLQNEVKIYDGMIGCQISSIHTPTITHCAFISIQPNREKELFRRSKSSNTNGED